MQDATTLTDFTLTEDDRSLARDIFGRFKQYPGSQHIATEFALSHLSALMRLTRPRTVLEIGAGIGTQTYLLLAHTNCAPLLVATESNNFCLEQLENNIPHSLRERYALIAGNDDLPESVFREAEAGVFGDDRRFDLVVMDVDAPEILFKYLNDGTYLFVEGNRRELRSRVQDHLATRGLKVEFTNYNRGKRLVELVFKPTQYGIKRPKIRFNKTIKGCWVGQVSKA